MLHVHDHGAGTGFHGAAGGTGLRNGVELFGGGEGTCREESGRRKVCQEGC